MKGGYLFELFTKKGDLTKVWGLVLCVFVTMSTGKKPRSVKMSGRKSSVSRKAAEDKIWIPWTLHTRVQ